MALPLLQARSISKTFTSRRESRCVLKDINLNFNRGERIAFVGPNGSGKTTLLRILLGIESADAGEVVWNTNLQNNYVAYVPQDYRHALFPWFKLRTNLAMASPAYRKRHLFSPLHSVWLQSLEKEYREIEASYSLHLNLDKYPYELSGGEQQIFLLIRSLLSNPQVLVLDEPLSAVDYGRKKKIRDSLETRIADSQMTLLFCSHDFEEAVQLSDRVIVFTRDSGNIKAVIPVDLPWPRDNSVRNNPDFIAVVDSVTQAIL